MIKVVVLFLCLIDIGTTSWSKIMANFQGMVAVEIWNKKFLVKTPNMRHFFYLLYLGSLVHKRVWANFKITKYGSRFPSTGLSSLVRVNYKQLPYESPILGQLLSLISPAKIHLFGTRFKPYDPWDKANCLFRILKI